MALVVPSDAGIRIEPGERPGADMAPRLLLALTALYVQRPTHTAEEQQQYSELALRLIDRIDAATHGAVAGILQSHPDAPAEVVERLGGAPAWRDGEAEGEPHAVPDRRGGGDERVKSDQQPSGAQCASTGGSSDVPSTGAPPPVCPLPAPTVYSPAWREGSGRGQGGEEGAFGEAFFAASAAERRWLLALMAGRYGDDAVVACEDGEGAFGSVDAAASGGRIGEFTREFERLIDLPGSLCERIVDDPSGEPIVVAAKAAGMPIAMLQRILLLVSRGASHSVERVYDLTELYHDLDGRAARDLLGEWRMQAPEADRLPGAPRGAAVASLRSRFGALAERVRSQAVNARCDRGSVAQRGLRSR